MTPEPQRGDLIPTPDEALLPPRYVPQRPLPPYRYVPGLQAHPTAHPDGHSFGQPEWDCEFLAAERWAENEAYLFGVDLFNRRFFWEAHESWEAVWHSCNKSSTQGLFIQGLIQVSAALLRWHMGSQRGAQKLYRSGRAKLQMAIQESPQDYMGIPIASWAQDLDGIFERLLEDDGENGTMLPVLRLNRTTGEMKDPSSGGGE